MSTQADKAQRLNEIATISDNAGVTEVVAGPADATHHSHHEPHELDGVRNPHRRRYRHGPLSLRYRKP